MVCKVLPEVVLKGGEVVCARKLESESRLAIDVTLLRNRDPRGSILVWCHWDSEGGII